MKKFRFSLCAGFLVVLASCSKSYVCACVDSLGENYSHTAKYVGNDDEGYLIHAEKQLVSKHDYESCVCRRD